MARVMPQVSLNPAGRFGCRSGRAWKWLLSVSRWLCALGVEWMGVPSIVAVTNDGFVVVLL